MTENLEGILNFSYRKFRGFSERDVKLEGVKEIYGKEADFLGVIPLFIDYGFS